jgi:hypothetical protein
VCTHIFTYTHRMMSPPIWVTICKCTHKIHISVYHHSICKRISVYTNIYKYTRTDLIRHIGSANMSCTKAPCELQTANTLLKVHRRCCERWISFGYSLCVCAVCVSVYVNAYVCKCMCMCVYMLYVFMCVHQCT